MASRSERQFQTKIRLQDRGTRFRLWLGCRVAAQTVARWRPQGFADLQLRRGAKQRPRSRNRSIPYQPTSRLWLQLAPYRVRGRSQYLQPTRTFPQASEAGYRNLK